MAPYRELVERRLELLLGSGSAATTELRELAEQAREFTQELQLTEEDRNARLDAVAELAAQVVPIEREACAVLGQAVGG